MDKYEGFRPLGALAADSDIECRAFTGRLENDHKFVICPVAKWRFQNVKFKVRTARVDYQEIIDRRRALVIEPYKSLADVGFDGPWVTPYQITSKSAEGPVLVALHWLDGPSILRDRATLQTHGYLPGIRFNAVIDAALELRDLSRSDIYVTQTFHLVPATRSERISPAAVRRSFDEVTRFEIQGRRVVALGEIAAGECRRHDIPHVAVCHPSRRGYSKKQNAAEIADAIGNLGF